MRAAADDVIRSPSVRHVAVVCIVVMLLVDVFEGNPISDVPTLPSPTSDYVVNKSVVFNLRVLYICDITSEKYCTANSTSENIANNLMKTLTPDEKLSPDCDGSNRSCEHSINSSQNSNSPNFTYQSFDDYVILTKRISKTTSLAVNVTFHVITGSLSDRISDVDNITASNSVDVIIAVGKALTVQTVAIVAEGQDLPALGYITEYGDGPKYVQGSTFTLLNPNPEAQGKALTQIIGQYNMKQTTVIIDDTKLGDGFLHGIRQTIDKRRQDIFNVLALRSDIGPNELTQKLTDVSNKGWKVMILHCSPKLSLKVVKSALSTRLYNTGYAWFLSEMAFSRNPEVVADFPEGLLAIDSFWLGGIPGAMFTALDYVISSVTCILNNQESSSNNPQVPYDGDYFVNNNINLNLEDSITDRAAGQVVYGSYFRNSSDFSHDFRRCLRMLQSYCDNSSYLDDNEVEGSNCYRDDGTDVFIKGENQRSLNDLNDENNGAAFYLLNTVADRKGSKAWVTVGYITANGQRDLRTVLWPGHNIYGPSSSAVKTYRVVTRVAEPFVFVSGKVSTKQQCFVDVPCLQVVNSSKSLLSKAVDDFQSDMNYVNELYTIHCCKGLSLEMLDALATDLNFRYIVYFVNDSNYGTLEKGNWTGMVGDVIEGAADMIAGAFSMTSQRMQVMDFTEPFYQNEFSLVTGEDGHYVSIWAFMSPFSGQVWLCIILSSIVAGIATSFLEWHSPFGLNPRGRKRAKNYGLGSGLLMVVVLLTGHTINIKAPKSWPGKVIQNVWAGLAIFIMTSYTANLAAYLAGQSAVPTVKNVFDSDLLTKKVAVIESSAVETFLDKINPKLSKRAKMNFVDSEVTAINKLRDHTIDVYLDDRPLLEHGLSKYDKDCKVRFAGKGFGSDGYAFGLPKHSWLKIPMSNKILWYTESGYMQQLAMKYLSRPQCEHFLAGTANPYGLEHTGGLFIILLSAVFISVLFLILEHLAYHFLVPWLRKQPTTSFWKTENLAFISQRAYRVVRSERLYSQKQAAQEMIKIVKQGDFTRIIQKNELQKRRATTQKRVKTKAEVFQEITANIVSYHRQLQSASETAENSGVDDAADFDDVDLDVDDLDSGAMGVNNAAYNGDNSDLALDIFFRRHGTSSSNEDENDDNCEFVFDDDDPANMEERANGPFRKLSSRSCNFPVKQHSEYPFRKKSDSFFLFPPLNRPPNGSYPSQLGVSDLGANSSLALPFPGNHSSSNRKRRPGRTLESTNKENNVQSPVVEISAAHVHTSPTQELPSSHSPTSPTQGDMYYSSPTSSSIQSPNDEKREFSPLPSFSSTMGDIPACDGSFGSLSTIPPDSSTSLASQCRDSLARGYESDDSQGREIPQATASKSSPKRQQQTPAGSETMTNRNSRPHRFAKQNQPKRGSKHQNASETTFPRSASSGEFSPQDPRNNNTAVSEPNNRDVLVPDIDYSVVGIPESETSFTEKGKKKGVFTIDGFSPKRVIGTLRKTSDVFPFRTPPSNEQQNNKRRTRSFDKSSRDYFKRNLRLKDNRVKSTLRRHAMSGYQSQLPADYIDECTLEALSKEDVLILWKKSEIDLESRLHEVLARNRRLSLAIDYLTRQETEREPEEV